MLILIAAQSIDGFIARHDQPGTAFCSDADATFLREALQEFDSLIMGRKTYDTLRDQIQNSTTTRFLRKIVTRDPQQFRNDEKQDLIEFTNAAPETILEELTQRGRSRTALLGGGEIYTQFLGANLVDELWLTIEPLLFGAGTPLVSKPIETDKLELKSSTPLNEQTLLLKYRFRRAKAPYSS